MLVYGLVLAPYGAWEWFGGHEPATVLHKLHATFWWGLLMLFFGLVYTVKFWPRPGHNN